MFSREDDVRIRRFGREMVVPANEVLTDDLFVHCGKWWKMTLITRFFMDLDHDDTFRFRGKWCRKDQLGQMAIALVLYPNIPFGAIVRDVLPPAVLPHDDVEQLAFQMVETP